MLLTVLDSSSVTQKVIVKGQEAVVDNSGTIGTANISQLAAAANANRSGFFLQNLGSHNMWFNDMGVATEVAGSVLLLPGAVLSSENYPVTTGAYNIIGTFATDPYTLRTW